jgi:hypothetical protein
MNMLTPKEIFAQQGYVLVKEFIPKQTAKYLFDYLRFATQIQMANGAARGDDQVPGSISAEHGDMAFEALMWHVHKRMQECTGLELIPTYTYRRLYRNGNVLHKHTDRPSCEVSATIKLSDTGGYNWPIWMVDSAYELEDGDAVLYRGCDLEHWRDVCAGPEGYLLGQVFTHFVDKNGPNTEYAYDKNNMRAHIFQGLIDAA